MRISKADMVAWQSGELGSMTASQVRPASELGPGKWTGLLIEVPLGEPGDPAAELGVRFGLLDQAKSPVQSVFSEFGPHQTEQPQLYYIEVHYGTLKPGRYCAECYAFREPLRTLATANVHIIP